MQNIGHLPIVIGLLLAILVGCGGSGGSSDSSASPDQPTLSGSSGMSPRQVNVYNNAGLSAADVQAQIEQVNAQQMLIQGYWGTHVSLVLASGEPQHPYLLLEGANSYGYGGYTSPDATEGHVDTTKAGEDWRALTSHVASNMATGNAAGQLRGAHVGTGETVGVEAFDYHLDEAGVPVQSPPYVLADFGFPAPAQTALGTTGLDYLGVLQP